MQAQRRTMDVVNRSNPCAGRFGALYSFYIERDRLARLVARLAWGVDSRPLYDSLSELASLDDGAVILDVPCGGGLALRALEPAQRVHYLAVDLDPRMLRRADRRAQERGLSEVDCIRADAARLPFGEETVDFCLCHGGLHCFSAPGRALQELARCLQPSGRLVGTTFVAPGTRRQRFLFRGERRRTGLPELWTRSELAEELHRAGFDDLELRGDAGYVLFRAEKPALPAEAMR